MYCRIARLALAALVAACLGAKPVLAAGRAGRAASAHHAGHDRHHRRLAAHGQAIQPLQQAVAPAAGTAPAPVPNEAMTAPSADRGTPETNVAPSVFQLHYPPQGDGYVTGSSPQAMDDRNAAKATGVEAKVPLPQ